MKTSDEKTSYAYVSLLKIQSSVKFNAKIVVNTNNIFYLNA